jgi:outer membrane protein TolC
VPIFAGGLTQSRVREARGAARQGGAGPGDHAAHVAQTTRQLYLNVSPASPQVRALEQALASTQSQLDSTILGRDVGVRTSVDVLNAQQQVFQTRRDLQQVRYNYLLNTLRLKAARGSSASRRRGSQPAARALGTRLRSTLSARASPPALDGAAVRATKSRARSPIAAALLVLR